jgi:AraC family transcriptional regulator
LGKIAAELERALAHRKQSGGPGHPAARMLAQGHGWTAEDVVCTSGPRDRSYEEQHSTVRIALVAAGSFQYRAPRGLRLGRELMTPGSLLLGTPGQYFECGHEHGEGDRCVSFGYSKEYFENLLEGNSTDVRFDLLRLPPLKETAGLVARASAALGGTRDADWEDLSVALAVRVAELSAGLTPRQRQPNAAAIARVTRLVRRIEHEPDARLTVATMARAARLSPYHFIRAFEQVTGLTPHRYVLRARLRAAALRLVDEPDRILDIGLDCGFGDISNFNRAFRAEFGVSPRAHRRAAKLRII